MDIIATAAIVICFVYAFINGFHDGCNVIATIISSRSISPKKALWIACAAEFAGPVLLGTGVAVTIGAGVVRTASLEVCSGSESILMFLSAMLGAIVWNLLTWRLGMPSSSSHALIGGLLGSGLALCGTGGINWDTFAYKVILVLFSSPVIGFAAGFVILKLVIWIVRDMHPRVNNVLKRIQVISMFILGMSHGSNDAQKAMGIIAMIMLLSGRTSGFVIPWWVQVGSALVISLGLSAGGWKLVKTVGTGIFSVKPIHSFSSQIASAATIITASVIGGPVSTTQIVNSSVMGVGTAERKNAVRWDMVRNILVSWICTIPAAAIVSAVLFYLLRYALTSIL